MEAITKKPWLEFLSLLGRGQVEGNIFLFLMLAVFAFRKATDITTGKDPQLSVLPAAQHMEMPLFFPWHLKLGRLHNKVKVNMPRWWKAPETKPVEEGGSLWVLAEVEARGTPAGAWEADPLPGAIPWADSSSGHLHLEQFVKTIGHATSGTHLPWGQPLFYLELVLWPLYRTNLDIR